MAVVAQCRIGCGDRELRVTVRCQRRGVGRGADQPGVRAYRVVQRRHRRRRVPVGEVQRAEPVVQPTQPGPPGHIVRRVVDQLANQVDGLPLAADRRRPVAPSAVVGRLADQLVDA
ncbi:hypothetical protein [Micromonospora sp. LOL_021]|uniref:hypothetical protein n=1 Tax=Micromonospora sp. LOL_021 TaxID=3345417 RepID=UPI003A8AF1DF